MDYVALGIAPYPSERQIIWRHVLPNSLTPVVTFSRFCGRAPPLALTSLDFTACRLADRCQSCSARGKNNIDAWWISLSTLCGACHYLFLLTFIRDAARCSTPKARDK
jgi:microcin C transport system permease protein